MQAGQVRPKALISAEAKKLGTFIKKFFNSLNDIQYFIVYFSRLALSLGHLLYQNYYKGGQATKPIVKNIYYKILYVIQGVKSFFDKST